MATQKETVIIELDIKESPGTLRTQNDIIKRNKALAKALRDAPREGEEGFDALRESIEKTKEEYAQNRAEIVKFNRELRETEVAADSLKGLSRELRDLEAEYKTLSKAQRQAFGADQQKRIKEIREELKKEENQLGDNRRKVGDYESGWKGVKLAIDDISASLKRGEDGAINIGSAFGTAGTAIKGVAIAAAAALVVGGAAAAAQEVGRITREFQLLRGEISLLTGATGGSLDKFATDVSAISKTFGDETERITLAANAVSKKLGVGFGEALEVVEDGYLAGANANGEFLDSLIEYPAVIDGIGATADEFVSIITQSAKEGIFSDKGIDAIKEGALSLREQTKATTEAVEALFDAGEGKELLGDIETGEISVIDGLKRISERLGELPPQSKVVGTAIADIFRGAGEDAGIGFLTNIQNIGSSTEELIDVTNELTRTQIRQLESEKEAAAASNETAKRFSGITDQIRIFGNSIKAFALDSLNKLFDAFAVIVDPVRDLFSALGGLAQRIGLVSEGGSFFGSVVDFIASGLRIFVSLVGLAIDGITVLAENLLFAANEIPGVSFVFDSLGKTITNIKDTFLTLPAVFAGTAAAVGQLGKELKENFELIRIEAELLKLRLKNALSFGDDITNEIKKLEDRKTEIKETSGTIAQAFADGFNEQIGNVEIEKAFGSVGRGTGSRVAETGETFGKLFGDGLKKGGGTAAEELAKSVPAALEKVLESGSLDALRAKAQELQTLLDGTDQSSAKYLEVAEKLKAANVALSEAEAARAAAITSDEDLIKAQTEAAEKAEAERQKVADTVRQNKENEIAENLASEIRAAQIARDEKLKIEGTTAKEAEAINDEYETAIAEKRIEAERQRAALLVEGSTERLAIETAIADEELRIRQELYASDVEAAKKAEAEKDQARKAFRDAALSAANLVSDAAFDIAKTGADNEKKEKLSVLEEEQEAKLLALEDEIVTTEERAEREKEIKAETEAAKLEIEKASFEEQKKRQIQKAIADGALAAIQALANTTLPFPASLAALIPIAAATALNIAKIKKTKFARGKGMIAKGRTHAQGGIDALLGGTEIVEIENDEPIITAASGRRYPQTLSDINQAGGGIQFPGTKRLTEDRKKRLSLLEMMSGSYPILRRGMAPVSQALREKRIFQDGGIAIAAAKSSGSTVSVLSERDGRLIADATYRGAKEGIAAANIAEKIRRQNERIELAEVRSEV